GRRPSITRLVPKSTLSGSADAAIEVGCAETSSSESSPTAHYPNIDIALSPDEKGWRCNSATAWIPKRSACPRLRDRAFSALGGADAIRLFPAERQPLRQQSQTRQYLRGRYPRRSGLRRGGRSAFGLDRRAPF